MVELCIHIANLCYLISFLCLDMMGLRILTFAGLGLGLLFFTCQPAPLYGPAVWHVVFLVINGAQIWRLVLERRHRMLTAEQERFAEATFQDLSREDLLNLLTRVMSKKPDKLGNLHHLSQQPLTQEERILREIAFSSLARKELLNLLTRRVWNSLTRRSLIRWRRSQRIGSEALSDGHALDVAGGPVTG